MMSIVTHIFFLKTLDALAAGLGVWLYVSPIASLQETVFLVSVAVMVQLLYDFRRWQKKKRSAVEYRNVEEAAEEKEEGDFDWIVFYGSMYVMGGGVWFFNYSELPTGELIFHTTLAIMIGILLGVSVEKRMWKRQLRKRQLRKEKNKT